MFLKCVDHGMIKELENFEQIFSGAPHRVVPDQHVQNVFKGLDKN